MRGKQADTKPASARPRGRPKGATNKRKEDNDAYADSELGEDDFEDEPKPRSSRKAKEQGKSRMTAAKAKKAKPAAAKAKQPRRESLGRLLKNGPRSGPVDMSDVIILQTPGPAKTKFVPKPGPASAKAAALRAFIEADLAKRRKKIEVVDLLDSSDEDEVLLEAVQDLDSDSELAADLPKKCRVGLKMMSREDVHYYQTRDEKQASSGGDAAGGRRTKVKYLGGQRVNVVETPAKRKRTPSPVIPRETWLPRRAAREKKVKYCDDYVSDFSEDEEEMERVRRAKRKLKRGHYDNDEDFSNTGTENSEPESDDSEYLREAERERKRERARAAAAMVNDLKLLHNIDEKKRLNRRFPKASGIERTFTVSGKTELAKNWLLFVKYLAMDEDTKDAHPFHPNPEHVEGFMRMLHRAKYNTSQLSSILKFIVNQTEWSAEDKYDFLSNATLPRRKEDDKAKIKENWKLFTRVGLVFKNKMFENFLVYCHGLLPQVDPFRCDFEVMVKFYKLFGIRGGITATKPNLAYFLQSFSVFHLSHYGENGRPLSERPHFNGLKNLDVAIEEQRMTFAGATEAEEKLLAEVTPDYKLEKYVKTFPQEDFWRERCVFTLMEEIFQEDEMVTKLDIREGANRLGVSVQMVFANFYKTVFPRELLPLVKSTCENDEAFWFQTSVEEILEKARDQDITLTEGAFEIGAQFREFKDKVGPLREKKPEEKKEKKERVVKNEMEKQVAASEKVEMSEYERIRLKNIEERLAMFKALNFGDFKQEKKTKTEAKEKEVIQSRERSKRIKNKETMGSNKATGLGGHANIETRVPAIQNIPLEDLIAVHMDLSNRKKILSCLHQEITHRDSHNEAAGAENGGTSDTVDIGHYSVKANFSLTSEKISTVNFFPHKEVNLLAAGDRSGAVTLWMTADHDLNSGRQVTFHPHSSQVNKVVFNPYAPHKLLSCSQDGYIRTTDLLAGRVDLTYNWSHFSENYFARVISHMVPRSEHEIVASRWDETVLLYDSRKPKTAKILVDNLRVTENETKLTPGYVSFHPTKEGVFAAPTADSVAFFDLRMEGKKLAEIETGRPVYVEFSSSGESILIVSDEKKDKRAAAIYKIDEDNLESEIVTTFDEYMAPNTWGDETKSNIVWNPWSQDIVFAAAKCNNADLIEKKSHSVALAAIDAQSGEINSSVDDALNSYEIGLAACAHSKTLAVFNSHANGSVTLVKSTN